MRSQECLQAYPSLAMFDFVGLGFRLFQGHAGLAIPTAQLGVIIGESAWFSFWVHGLEERGWLVPNPKDPVRLKTTF